MRYIFLFLLGLFGIWWLRRKVQGVSGGVKPSPPERAIEIPEKMRECAQCGINVPESEGVSEGEAFYCCVAHRQLGPRA